MKKMITALAAALIFSAFSSPAQAAGGELKPVHITGYCLQGLTKTETPVRPGICAYKPEDLGRTAIVYSSDMTLIGIYEIQDTGSDSINKGYVLDIWCETKEECFEITREGYVQVIDAEG